MSAPLSHQQLAMFLTPKEIQSRGVSPHEKSAENYNWHEERQESDEELWTRKFEEAHEWDTHGTKKPYDLATDIAKHGVKKPVKLSTKSGYVTNGYHRVAAAATYRPKDLIPVEYDE